MKTKRKATLSLSGTNLYFPYFSCLKKIQTKYLKQELYFRRRKSIVFICIPGYWLFSEPLKKIFLQHSDGQGLNGSGLRSVRKSVSRNLTEKRTEGEGGGSQTQTCEIWKCGEKKKNICGNNTILFSAHRWLGDLIETSETEVDLGEDITLIRWATCSWSWSWSSSWFWWWSWWWWFWSWFWWWWWGEEWFTWTSIL